MKKYYLNIGATCIALSMVGCLTFEVDVSAQAQPSASQHDNEAPQLSTEAPPPGFATRWDYVKSFTSEKDILNAYHAGLLNKDECMLAMSRLGNTASMDTYGKVIDQNGQPIVDVKVQGLVKVGIGDSKEHDTKTDAQGQFHFLGLHGQGLGIRLQKEGYEYGYKIPYQRPSDYLPEQNNPLIITMWKLHGAEPMVHVNAGSGIACDGTPTRFDLLTGKKNTNGDLIVKLTRNPVNIDRRKPFNWLVTLEVTNGGLQEASNIYPYEAPVEDYQSEITYNFQTNAPNWTFNFTPSLYFKGRAGQIYGRMTVNIMANFQPPPTYFGAEIYANPAGSRDLEFDPTKQIKR